MKTRSLVLASRNRTKLKRRGALTNVAGLSSQPKRTMRAVAIDRFGPPSVLTVHELPVPKPGPNEVLIALYAAGVGVWDADIRGGWWPEGKPKFPLVMGTDGAGVVAATGAKVHGFYTGDRVWAFEFVIPRGGGFYAEYVAVDARNVGLVPNRLDLLDAGAAAVTGLTALQGIEGQLRVRSGQTVLIFGASGAVGTLAVQFAKAHGARVIATARGAEAQAVVKKLGADKVFDPTRKDAIEQVRAFAPKGIDAVLALAGGKALQRLLPLVRSGGRVAHPNGVDPEPKAPPKVKLTAYDAKASPREFERLNRAVDAAQLQVPIAAVRTLKEAAKAHERIEKGHVVGRVVLKIRDGGQKSPAW